MKKSKTDAAKLNPKGSLTIGYDIDVNTDIAAQLAFDRMDKEGFDALSVHEKTIASAWLFAGKVANEGFRGYFTSAAGDVALYVPTAMRAIGAGGMAALAEQANSVFGAGGPPRDRNERKKLVRAFGPDTVRQFEDLEKLFYECPDDVDALLDAYLRNNRSA